MPPLGIGIIITPEAGAVQRAGARRPRRARGGGSALPAACRRSNRSALRAQAADGPRRRFQHPGALAVVAQFGMCTGPWCRPSACTARAVVSSSASCTAARLARRRHVDGLFEERALQRIGLVEDRQRLEIRRAVTRPFDGELAAFDVAFHLQTRRSPSLPDAPEGGDELRCDRWRESRRGWRKAPAASARTDKARAPPARADRPSSAARKNHGTRIPAAW